MAAFPKVAQRTVQTKGFIELEGRSRGALFLSANYFWQPMKKEEMQFDLPWDIDTERFLEVLDEATRDDEEEKGQEAPEFGKRVVKFAGAALKK